MELTFEFLKQLTTSTIGGLPIIFLIVIAVFGIRKLTGWEGQKLTYTAMVVGVVLGVLQYLAAGVLPGSVSEWTVAVIFALALGFFSTLFYDLMGQIVLRGVEKHLEAANEAAVMGSKYNG